MLSISNLAFRVCYGFTTIVRHYVILLMDVVMVHHFIMMIGVHDCWSCEDEPDWTCGTCPGCPSTCGGTKYCDGNTNNATSTIETSGDDIESTTYTETDNSDSGRSSGVTATFGTTDDDSGGGTSSTSK